MAEQVRVTKLSKLTEGEPFCLQHKGVPYVVVRTKKGIKAYVSFCSHKELVMFPPIFKGSCLVCPHHKVEFAAVSGKVKDDQGKVVPFGLLQVRVVAVEGVLYLWAKKKHRKLIPKQERKRVVKTKRKRTLNQ
jgi:nitrite reductase/ring-hydroxylating ferredoxin subunit